MDIKDIQTIIQLLKQNEISEFELEHDGTKVKLVRGSMVMAQVVQSPSPLTGPALIQPAIGGVAPGGATQGATAEQRSAELDPTLKKVESPIVGSFYRRPSPEAESFVKEGDRVSKGTTLCIIEAMKVMNEIESPIDGVIEKIIPSDGEVVEFGEVLFLIKP